MDPLSKSREDFLAEYFVNYGKALMAKEIATLLSSSEKQVEYINQQINKVINPYVVGKSNKETSTKPKKS